MLYKNIINPENCIIFGIIYSGNRITGTGNWENVINENYEFEMNQAI